MQCISCRKEGFVATGGPHRWVCELLCGPPWDRLCTVAGVPSRPHEGRKEMGNPGGVSSQPGTQFKNTACHCVCRLEEWKQLPHPGRAVTAVGTGLRRRGACSGLRFWQLCRVWTECVVREAKLPMLRLPPSGEVVARGPKSHVGTDTAEKYCLKTLRGNYICQVKGEQKVRKRWEKSLLR